MNKDVFFSVRHAPPPKQHELKINASIPHSTARGRRSSLWRLHVVLMTWIRPPADTYCRYPGPQKGFQVYLQREYGWVWKQNMSPQWCCAGLFRTAIWLEEDQYLQMKTGHYSNVFLKSDVPTESGVHVLLLPPNTTTSLSRPRHAVWHPLRGNNPTINTPFRLFSWYNHGQKNDSRKLGSSKKIQRFDEIFVEIKEDLGLSLWGCAILVQSLFWVWNCQASSVSQKGKIKNKAGPTLCLRTGNKTGKDNSDTESHKNKRIRDSLRVFPSAPTPPYMKSVWPDVGVMVNIERPGGVEQWGRSLI